MGSHLVHSSYFSEKPLLWLAAWLFLDSYLWTCALEASEGYKQGFAKKKEGIQIRRLPGWTYSEKEIK
jgi:hypothetical protein